MEVFISSTARDLLPHREAAKQAILGLDCLPVMMEYFEAGGGNPPLEVCLKRVRERASVVILLVAYRYGWVPSDDWPDLPDNYKDKSITWLECQTALEKGLEVIPLLVDPAHPWPPDYQESNQFAQVIASKGVDSEAFRRLQRNLVQLDRFKQWLGTQYVFGLFTDPKSVEVRVQQSLSKWLQRQARVSAGTANDPKPYLQWLLDRTGYFELPRIRQGAPSRIPLDQLYVPLECDESPEAGATSASVKPGRRPLEPFRQENRLVLLGGAGSGKTTFLKRIAADLSRRTLEDELQIFPVYVQAAELAEHIRRQALNPGPETPLSGTAPLWLSHYMWKAASQDRSGTLPLAFYESRLKAGRCCILIDGLDESSGESLAPLISAVSTTYSHCSVLVTSRPRAFTSKDSLPGFRFIQIAPMARSTMKRLLLAWGNVFYPAEPHKAQHFASGLLDAIQQQPELPRLAANPSMLTALALVSSGRETLPAARSELYEKIVSHFSRGESAGRNGSTPALDLLQELALAMQADFPSRQTHVDLGWAEEKVAALLGSDRLGPAAEFLNQQENASGLYSINDHRLSFWHASFQDFLSARAIAERREADQDELLRRLGASLYAPDRRELILFLAELLEARNPDRLRRLITTLSTILPAPSSLTGSADCLILLDGIRRHLREARRVTDRTEYTSLLERLQPVIFSDQAAELDPLHRVELSRAFGHIPDPRLAALDWVPLSAGCFCMGAQARQAAEKRYDPEAKPDEGPVHEVDLAAFAISRFPVTVGQYDRFVQDNGYARKAFWESGGYGRFHTPSHWDQQLKQVNAPVTGVSWFEAAAYCAWAAVRLPSEAEWERAAAGLEGRIYPWGDAAPSQQHARFDSVHRDPTAVGLFPEGSTPEGVFELAGNVWEWVFDTYAKYAHAADRHDSETQIRKAVRGGSYSNRSEFLRTSVRAWAAPGDRYSHFGAIGFRCARTPGQG
ncbi:MAG: SUMF1/EgtB/PvdO family nonheme iron enzyme [Paludibaculum sp.]